MAKKLGYENYIELGYANMGRTDYDATMVASYRKQVLESVVPVAHKLCLLKMPQYAMQNWVINSFFKSCAIIAISILILLLDWTLIT